MRFLVISHAAIKQHENTLYGYAPYIREMNLWFKFADEVEILSPVSSEALTPIDLALIHPSLELNRVPLFSMVSFIEGLNSFWKVFGIAWIIIKAMHRADHIHLRCPGNMGLLGSILQVFFPRKKKTAKYAGNWDWNSKQPWSYRLQQRILRSAFLSKNTTVLVYGEWSDRTRNILPFFTASYSSCDAIVFEKPPVEKGVQLIFAGGLTANKQPILAVQTLEYLIQRGINAHLHVCGDGPERARLEAYCSQKLVQPFVSFYGNVQPEQLKFQFINAHFLLFASRSEGWPKVVAEAMWWGCIPITTAVSCVPQMVGFGERGVLVQANPEEMCNVVTRLRNDENIRLEMVQRATEWAREFTLERFEMEIRLLMQ